MKISCVLFIVREKNVNDTSANFLGMLGYCRDKSNSIHLHIFVYIAEENLSMSANEDSNVAVIVMS